MTEFIAFALGIILGLVIAPLFFLGVYVVFVGHRFTGSASEAGIKFDKSAFWGNFLAWIWLWAERSKEIIQAMPFFKRDLSETLGVKPDDGKDE